MFFQEQCSSTSPLKKKLYHKVTQSSVSKYHINFIDLFTMTKSWKEKTTEHMVMFHGPSVGCWLGQLSWIYPLVEGIVVAEQYELEKQS